jgi:hypothetical protein
MSIRHILFSIFFIFFLVLIYFSKPSFQYKTQTVYIKNQKLIVEIADTDNLREKGLSKRFSLDKNKGMLFIFPKAGLYRFWMKEMNFPLDFIWISNDRIVDLTENVPIASNNITIPTFEPQSTVDKVLEVNAGTIKSLNISLGDKIKY